jgi:hypothetical protein
MMRIQLRFKDPWHHLMTEKLEGLCCADGSSVDSETFCGCLLIFIHHFCCCERVKLAVSFLINYIVYKGE